MTRVFLADAKIEERPALRLLFLDLKLEVVGEAADCPITFAHAPFSRTEMFLADWNLLPNVSTAAQEDLRKACPAARWSCKSLVSGVTGCVLE